MKIYAKRFLSRSTYCLCLILTLILCSTTSLAINDEELFSQANEHYKKGEISQAYNLYQQISNKGPTVHYNLGNCAYKMSHLGQALVHWRRAERDWGFFGREELLKNIELVKKQTVSQRDGSNKEQTLGSALYDFVKSNKTAFVSAARSISLLYLQLIVLMLWLVLFFYIRYLYKKKQRTVIVGLFLLQAVFFFMLAIKYGTHIREYAIIIKPQATLLSGPGGSFALMQRLPEAQEGVILKESGDYYKIRINNNIGWIEKNSIEKI